MKRLLFPVMLLVFLAANILIATSGCTKHPVVTANPCGGILPTGIIRQTPFPTNANIFHNSGTVCFQKLSENVILARLSAPGCFPTGCTLVYERTGNMKIDPDNFTIQFTMDFVALNAVSQPEGKGCLCDMDCGGAGYLQFEIKDLATGLYTIKLGDLSIGQVSIPLPLNETFICLDTKATATSIPTP